MFDGTPARSVPCVRSSKPPPRPIPVTGTSNLPSHDPFAACFSGDSPWGACRPRGWVGFWLKVARTFPGGWPWSRFALLARRFARLRLDGPLDVRAWGFKLRLKPRGSVSEARILFLPRYWDRAERGMLANHLVPGSVFVDVGANAGGYTFWAASLAGESGRVLAFEPDPALARQLRYNVRVNGAEGRIAVVEAAVGASPGEGRLVPDARNSGENRLAGDLTPGSEPGNAPDCAGGGFPVRVVALAGAVEDAGLDRIDCLKVDVEGREADVLKPFFSAAPPRLWPRVLVVELLNEPPANPSAEESRDLERWIVARGYRLVLRTKLNGVFHLERDPWPAARPGRTS